MPPSEEPCMYEVNHIGIVLGTHLREPLPYKSIFIVRESCVEYVWSKWNYMRKMVNNTHPTTT